MRRHHYSLWLSRPQTSTLVNNLTNCNYVTGTHPSTTVAKYAVHISHWGHLQYTAHLTAATEESLQWSHVQYTAETTVVTRLIHNWVYSGEVIAPSPRRTTPKHLCKCVPGHVGDSGTVSATETTISNR